jgi:tetratricopeptide (TPR) repeat protein
VADADAWNALAWSYLQSGRSELGLDAARRAHEASRGNVDYLNTLGVAYAENGELALAEATFRKLLKRKPGWVDAIVNLAKALEKQEALAEALGLYERALAIQPTYPRLATNLARLYRECGGQAQRAAALLERHANPAEDEDLVLARSSCDLELAGVDAALARLSGALAQHPDWQLARQAFAQMLLSAGRWSEGWREYVWRRPRPGVPASLAQHTELLLLGEQGLGDVLFFLRFAPLLRGRGTRLTLACEAKLHALLEPGPLLQAIEAPAGAQRGGVWLGDLPALLECSDTPAAWPLAVTDQRRNQAKARLAALGPPPYLAVTWRAGTDVARGREFGAERMSLMKAIPPAELGAALRGWRGTLIALQRGARPGEAAQFGAPFHDLSFLGDDLPALAAVLAELDEYVTVSNTNVHLVAGLGKTARVLVPYPAEWRWMRREGASPWFPDFPLYRQRQSRDWSGALAALRRDLAL